MTILVCLHYPYYRLILLLRRYYFLCKNKSSREAFFNYLFL